MSATKLSKLTGGSLSWAVLLIAASMLMSVSQIRAETVKDRTVAFSLAEVTLEPGTKVLVILGTGEKIKGKVVDIGDGALFVSTKDGIRRLSESEISQICRVKGISRAMGALIGATIGIAVAIPLTGLPIHDVSSKGEAFAANVSLTGPIGAFIVALASGEETKWVYHNPTISLTDVTLEPGARHLVILGTGENIKGKATDISDGELSILTDYVGIRRLSESDIFQIFQVKGTSRSRGVLYGMIIGTAGALVSLAFSTDYNQNEIAHHALVSIFSGVSIGALISGGKKRLVYQNPLISPPSDSKTGLINFRDGRLSFDVPSIYLRPNHFDGFRVKPFVRRTKHIELVSVEF